MAKEKFQRTKPHVNVGTIVFLPRCVFGVGASRWSQIQCEASNLLD